jgi:fumarylacetoacetate (FAA) hydrolase family protein
MNRQSSGCLCMRLLWLIADLNAILRNDTIYTLPKESLEVGIGQDVEGFARAPVYACAGLIHCINVQIEASI